MPGARLGPLKMADSIGGCTPVLQLLIQYLVGATASEAGLKRSGHVCTSNSYGIHAPSGEGWVGTGRIDDSIGRWVQVCTPLTATIDNMGTM
jgi:hypothetical protein